MRYIMIDDVKKSLFAFIIFQVLTANIAFGQQKASFPKINNEDLTDAKITDTRLYNAESLYGYIDGGAELYLEYGFDTLLINDISFKAGEIKVELYKMIDAEAAFGIFSVSHFKCNRGSQLTEYYCQSKYQVQFCRGCYYASIINSNGTEEEQKLSEHIASLLINRITGIDFDPSDYFTPGVDTSIIESMVLVKGRLGLFNGAYGLSETLEDCDGYSALIIKNADNTSFLIHFSTDDAMGEFVKKSKADISDLNAGKAVVTSGGDSLSLSGERRVLLKIGKGF